MQRERKSLKDILLRSSMKFLDPFLEGNVPKITTDDPHAFK